MPSHESIQPTTENRASFEKRISVLPYSHQIHVRRAYNLAKEAHREDVREGGERYFEHVRSVFNILFDEAGIKDPILGAAAFLHDAIEDTDIRGELKGRTNSAIIAQGGTLIENWFGEETARITLNLTKPFIDGIEVLNKEQKDEMYHEQLVTGASKTIIIKMADRLHNLRTLGARSRENQIKIVNETIHEYFPLFETVRETYPEATEHLLREMKLAIAKLGIN